MARISRFNTKFLKALKPGARVFESDKDISPPRFGVRRSKAGARSWVQGYLDKNRLYREFAFGRVVSSSKPLPETKEEAQRIADLAEMALDGRHPTLTLAEARRVAKVLHEKAGKGLDLVSEAARRRGQAAADADGIHTVADVIAAFKADRVSKQKPRGQTESNRILDKIAARWNNRKVADIRPEDVEAFIAPWIKTNKKFAAERALSELKRLFAWCADDKRIPITFSPAASVKTPFAKGERKAAQRAVGLSDHGVRIFWQAIEGWHPFGAAFGMMLLTAQRRSEVSQMKWAEVDLDNAVWVIPASRAKNGQLHKVALSNLALELLEQCPNKDESDAFVFSSTDGRRPISGFSKAKRELHSRIETLIKDEGLGWTDLLEVYKDTRANRDRPADDFRLHDLRRTAATRMAEIGIQDRVIALVLNHTRSDVTSVYNRHPFEEERREALQAWADRIATLADTTGKVVQFDTA